jgi:hypothetical protein
MNNRFVTVFEHVLQGHTGTMSPVTAALKFVGSAIRLITTLIEIGKDKALLTSYGLGAALNGVLVAQVQCS